jgi:DegV family protein with EDD domain
MTKIAVITDTDSSLTPQMAEQYGIRLVPITIEFGEESFISGLDIDDRLLFEKIDRQNKLPTTSAPSPNSFAQAYEEAFTAGAQAVVCICVSSKVSSTYSSAITASESFAGQPIAVVDSLNLSMGQGFMALAAAEAAQNGASMQEAAARAAEVGERLHLYAVVPTLKYLALSGRVGKLMAGMADTLDIKPVLTVRDGSLVLLEKVRTRKKAVERM